MQRRILIGALALAIIAGGAWFLTRPATPADPLLGSAMAQEAEVDVSQIVEMVQGEAEAPVEVIEYASYTCPHCANFHANQYEELKAQYIDTGAVRFVYREVYFDRFGLWASMVARCGGEEKFFGITEVLYDTQREWTQGEPANIAQNLRRIGLTAGLTEDELEACLTDASKAQSLVAWYEENRAEHDVNSTPTFIIDGEKHANMSFADFAAILDARLDAAGWQAGE